MKKYFPIIALLILFSACENKQNQPVANKGIISIDTLQIKNNNSVKLTGEWEYYDNKLLTPDSFKNIKYKPEYITLPSLGKKSKLNKKGFSTFRLFVEIKNLDFDIALSCDRIFSSYKIWVNGKLVSNTGIVSRNKETYNPELKITFTKLQPEILKNDTLEIIVQSANFDDPVSGIITPFVIQNYETSFKDKVFESAILVAILSIVLMLGLFSFIMFIKRKKDYSSLYLSGLSMVFLVFGISTNDTFIKNIFLSDFTLITRFVHISVSIYPVMIILFFSQMFKNEISKFILRLTILLSISLITFSVFADVSTIRDFAFLKGLYIMFIFCYLVFYAIPIAIYRKLKGSTWAFLGMFFLFVTSFNDILFSLNIVNIGYLSIYGFLIYFFFQTLNLASNFAYSLSKNEELLHTLDFQNKNLEKIVVERTKEIQENQKIIIERNNKLEMQNEEIISQREAIFINNEKIRHQNIQTNSSIKYAGTIQKAIMPQENALKNYLDYFILSIPKEKISGDFYWFSVKKNRKKLTENIYIAVVDCTGHGVPGAFVSVLGNMILKDIINTKQIKKPSDILNKMNEEIIKTLKQGSNNNTDGMDVVLVKLKKINGNIEKITFSGAKSPLYLVNKSGKITRIKGSPKPIGGIIDSDFDFYYTDTIITPEKGDSFYLTTDGYIDQNNNDRQRFGTVKLMKLLRIISKRETNLQKEVLHRELIDFMEDEEQRDDITILGFKI
jgi:serine phosphatase RsbU (regulator of sigma subunit)